jgi:hypothetical protein
MSDFPFFAQMMIWCETLTNLTAMPRRQKKGNGINVATLVPKRPRENRLL